MSLIKKVLLRSVAIVFFILALSVYLTNSSEGCDPKSLFDCGMLTMGFLTSLHKILGLGVCRSAHSARCYTLENLKPLKFRVHNK